MKYLIDKNNRNLLIRMVFIIFICFILSFYSKYLTFIILLITLTMLIYQYIKNRDQKVTELNLFLKRMNQGDYTFEIEAYQEGELSKLQSELNKTTIHLQQMNFKLTSQKDTLQKALEDISHQLKTPIASLLLINELQKKDELVDKSKDQLQRLHYLVDSLLRLVKLDANLEEFEIEAFSLKNLVEETVSLVSILNLDIKIKIDVDPLTCMGDFQKSKEALLNILYNKLRHAQSEITITSKQEHLSSVLSVFDDGDPILNQSQVFERFYSGDKRDSKSIGIGLSIAQELMEKQQGSLSIRDKNTFVFRFNKL